MNPRLLTGIILAVAAMAGTVAVAQCCTSGQQDCKTHCNGQDSCSVLNPAIGATDTISYFRFERYDVNKPKKSEVLQLSKYDSQNLSHYLYFRMWGSNKGYSYSDVSTPNELTALGNVVANLHPEQYPCINFEDEDKGRSRWMLRVRYTSGKETSIVQYTDQETSPTHVLLIDAVEPIFKGLSARAIHHELKSDYSISSYDPDGNLIQRIDYTAQGIVHGGYNPNKPGLTY